MFHSLAFAGGLAVVAAEGWQTWVPVGSATIAAFSFLVALANRRTARRALRLSEQQEERRRARLDLSLNSAELERDLEADARVVVLDVLAVNPTDRDGSLVSADLHVTYSSELGGRVVIKVPQRPGCGVQTRLGGLELPARLPANGAVRGILEFELKDELLRGGRVDQYELTVADSRGISASCQPWAMKEIQGGEA